MKKAFLERESSLYGIAIVISLLLSFWMSFRETVINPDAICYLLSAKAVGEEGLRGAMQLCGQAKWPFYSVLIYGFVKLTHFSYTTAAYVLNAAFSVISVIAFIRIVKELGASQRVLWLAAGIILFWHEFNGVREYIVRDHGFWAFYLSSIFFLLYFFRKPSLLAALAWSASLLIATLFRIEGAIFLLLMPFVSWFFLRVSLKERMKNFFMLNVPLFFIGAALIAWLLLHPEETLSKLGRVAEVPNQIQHGFVLMFERYQQTTHALSQYVLSMESARDAGFVFVMLLIVWYLLYIIANLSWGYFLLVAFAWLRRIPTLTTIGLLVIGGYLLINFAITAGFLAERLFLSKRYLIAFSLVFMLFVPFALDYLLQHRNQLRHRLMLFIAVGLILISSTGGIIKFGYSKTYIHDAGTWLAQNVPANASLYVNDYQVMYYSEHFGNSIFEKHNRFVQLDSIAQGKWKQYDYLALRVSKKNEAKLATFVAESKLKPIQTFSNTRGDSVIIFRNF